jgi:hypothetical protein
MKLSYGTKNFLRWTGWFFAILVIGYFYINYPFYKMFPNVLWLPLVWLGGIFLLVGILSGVAGEAGKWRRGIEAEHVVEDISYELPRRFNVLRNIIIGEKGNIDEIIVGPTGIWVIEVKSHSGRITFDGKELRRNGELFEKDFLKQAWAEGCAVRDILKKELNEDFFIQPVICFSSINTKLHFGKKPIKGVYVIGLKWLNELVFKSSTRLADSTAYELAEILKNYEE